MRVWRWLAGRDPHGFALRRAVRAAVVVPLAFAIGAELIGNPQVATFAAFGSFALLLFVNFSGSLATRAGGYAGLGGVGAVLIALGTAWASPDWLAVAGMAIVGFLILFAGVISSMISAASQAALLTFILSVMLPGASADLPSRLAGWGIAVALAGPVALLVWPARDQDEIRLRSAALCRAMADMLALEQPPLGGRDPLVAMRAAARELREAFVSSSARTAGLSTGARLLIRLVDELEWLATIVVNACADAPEQWPQQGQRLRTAAAAVLRSCGDTLDYRADRPDPRACGGLEACLGQLEGARRAVSAEALAELRAGAGTEDGRPSRGEFDRPLYAAHELGFVVAEAGGTVAQIAAADSRSWWAKLTGRRVTTTALGTVAVARRLTANHLDRHSVALQSSLRAAAGLALAVLLARVVDAQNAFWIGLGALSVLRSNALSTGATVARALVGTAVGFAVGAAIVAGLGTSHAILWPLLPVAILVAAFAPAVISFVAGQAAFTVVTIVLFNIIAPAGWRVGVLRIEDVALGCAASLGAGLLFWPRGAAAALGAAFAEAYATSARYVQQVIEHLTGQRSDPPDLATASRAAGQRLDDALRQYLAERGAKNVPLEDVIALVNGSSRLRLAASAIGRLDGDGSQETPDPDARLAGPAQLLGQRARQVTDWYAELAAGFQDPRKELPTTDGSASTSSFLDVVLPAVEACSDGVADRAERLLWSGQYLGDLDQLRQHLREPAAAVAAARTRPWWQR